MNQYKEILKEVAPGVWTHSHWEDENGNVVEPEPSYSTLQEAQEAKLQQLKQAYEQSQFDPISYRDRLFGNAAADQIALDAADRLVGRGKFPSEGVEWDTLDGEETLILYAADIDALKDIQTLMLQQNFQKFKRLDTQRRQATTIEEVMAITW